VEATGLLRTRRLRGVDTGAEPLVPCCSGSVERGLGDEIAGFDEALTWDGERVGGDDGDRAPKAPTHRPEGSEGIAGELQLAFVGLLALYGLAHEDVGERSARRGDLGEGRRLPRCQDGRGRFGAHGWVRMRRAMTTADEGTGWSWTTSPVSGAAIWMPPPT